MCPHMFRHTYASRLNEICKDEILIAALLGHKNSKITRRYISLNKKYIIENVKKLEQEYKDDFKRD